MNEAIEISKLIDKYLPANGVGTEREQIRMEMHNDIAMLVKNLTIPRVINSATAQMIHYDLVIKANEVMKEYADMKVEDFRELPEVKKLWGAMDIIKEYYL
jgi:hypothetical protein